MSNDCKHERDLMARNKFTQTKVADINPGDLLLLRYLAAVAIKDPATKWRHNGQGMLQGYLYEGTSSEARVHIWHDSLRKPGIFDNGLIHDHRFDMRSHVILGGITHLELNLVDAKKGKPGGGRIMEITNARKAKQKTGESYHMDPQDTGEYVVARRVWVKISDQVYTFPRFRYHKAYTSHETTVSIVLKSRQADVKARLLDMADAGKLVNSFENPLTREEFQPVLDDTLMLLERK